MPVDTRLTYEDYCLLPKDGKRYEIIDGELFVTPAPCILHQRVVTRLSRDLSTFVEDNHLGLVLAAPTDVVLSHFDVVQPDIVYISKIRASIVTDKNLQGAPDLVVEILSEFTARIDRTAKLKLYAKHGVRECWLIDPDQCSAQIYRRQNSAFELVVTLQAGDSLTSPLFPGFSLPLQKLIE